MKNVNLKTVLPVLVIGFSFLITVNFMLLVIDLVHYFNVTISNNTENVPIFTPVLLMEIILSFIVAKFKEFDKLLLGYILCFVISFLSIAFNSTTDFKWIWSEFVLFHILVIHIMIKFWHKIIWANRV